MIVTPSHKENKQILVIFDNKVCLIAISGLRYYDDSQDDSAVLPVLSKYTYLRSNHVE